MFELVSISVEKCLCFGYVKVICRLLTCYLVRSVSLWTSRWSAGVPGAERLPGPHADAGSAGAGQCHRPPGASLPPAGQLSAVPGAPGGAVPQAHVPLLKPCICCSRLHRSLGGGIETNRERRSGGFSGLSEWEAPRVPWSNQDWDGCFMRDELYKAIFFYLRTSYWCLKVGELEQKCVWLKCRWVLCSVGSVLSWLTSNLRPQRPGTSLIRQFHECLCSFIKYFGKFYNAFIQWTHVFFLQLFYNNYCQLFTIRFH